VDRRRRSGRNPELDEFRLPRIGGPCSRWRTSRLETNRSRALRRACASADAWKDRFVEYIGCGWNRSLRGRAAKTALVAIFLPCHPLKRRKFLCYSHKFVDAGVAQ